MNMIPESLPLVMCVDPCAASVTGDSGDSIKLTNAKGAWIVCFHAAANDNDVTLTVHEGETAAVAKAGTYDLATTASTTFPIWLNNATGTSDTLVRQTDAVSLVIDSDVGGDQIVVIYVEASKLTNGRDWINCGFDAGHASNFLTIFYILDGARYQQATPPTAIA